MLAVSWFQAVQAGIQSRGRGEEENACSQKLGNRPSSRNKQAPPSLEGNSCRTWPLGSHAKANIPFEQKRNQCY